MKAECIKHAQEALLVDPKSSKAHYRIFKAHMTNNDFDKAVEALKAAIKLEPTDQFLRKEWEGLKAIKDKKEREWSEKMSGFYETDKFKSIEERDAFEKSVKDKVWQKVLREEKELKA